MNSNEPSNHRERIVLFLILFGITVIFARLVSIQLIHHTLWKERALERERAWIKRLPARGNIFDCEGRPLAMSLPLTYAVGYRQKACSTKAALYQELEPLLCHHQKNLKARLNQNVRFTYLARRVDWRTADAIKALDFPCLELVEEPRRSYPNNRFAASLIGFADIDQVGQEGMELQFDKRLRGDIARELMLLDNSGQPCMHLSDSPETSNQGADIQLTIDIPLQTIVEEELETAMQTQECKRACIILTNPQTGEILALATYPGFNPNKPGQAAAGARKCWPITDVMEHGSTLKILPFAGALTKNLYKLADSIFCENGHYRVRGAVIHDAHPQGMLTFADVLAHSSNIGAVKIAERLGKNDLYKTARRFGFGNPTDIMFPGEQAGYLPPPHKWTGPTLANIAFGHGLSATPLQIVMAYGAIANGGYQMEPRIVKRIFHSAGDIEEFSPSIVRQALSHGTARSLTELLVGVVEDGTGKAAAISPWRIAGKTGTGQKINHETNQYYDDRFVSSFVGFIPAESPCYLMLVLVDDPQEQHYASQVAAPVFRNAMARILECRPPAPAFPQYPETSSPNDLTEIITDTPPEERIESVQNYNQPYAQETIVPAALTEGMETGYIQVPSVQGLPFRHAIYEITSRNLDVRISGLREVVSQSPAPGSIVPVGTTCILQGFEEQKN